MESNDGPFTIWKMLNVPMIALFENLDMAECNFKYLMTSLLNSSSNFPEVLVPRDENERCHITYYKSFTKWLLGRLFYTSSSISLKRIHKLSTEVQTKICLILLTYNAEYCSEIQDEYMNVTRDLVDYNQNISTQKHVTLKYFIPEHTHIEEKEIVLLPIFLEVRDIDTCYRFLMNSLRILRVTIPSCLFYNHNLDQAHEEFFDKIITLLSDSSIIYKRKCLKFFSILMTNLQQYGISFYDRFTRLSSKLIVYMECLIVYMTQNLSKINDTTLKHYVKIYTRVGDILNYLGPSMIGTKDGEIVANICNCCLNSSNIPPNLEEICVKLSCQLDHPHSYYQISNLNLQYMHYYVYCFSEKIITALRAYDENVLHKKIQENHFYNELFETSKCIQNVKEVPIEMNLERFLIVLQIYQNILYKLSVDENLYMKYLKSIHGSENLYQYLINVENLLTEHVDHFRKSQKAQQLLLKVLTALANLFRNMTNNAMCSWYRCCTFIDKKYLSVENIGCLIHTLLVYKLFQKNSGFVLNLDVTISNLLQDLIKEQTLDSGLAIINLANLLIVTQTKSLNEILCVYLQLLQWNESSLDAAILQSLPTTACLLLNDLEISWNLKDLNVHICIDYNSGETKEQGVKLLEYKVVPKDSTRTELERFLSRKLYKSSLNDLYGQFVVKMSKDGVYNDEVLTELFNGDYDLVNVIQGLLENVMKCTSISESVKKSAFDKTSKYLSLVTSQCLNTANFEQQIIAIECIKKFATIEHPTVLHFATKLLVFFIMSPKSVVAKVASCFLAEVCNGRGVSSSHVYHMNKKEFCKYITIFCVGESDTIQQKMTKVLQAFDFVNYRSFLQTEANHFLPYVLQYTANCDQANGYLKEIATLLEVTAADVLRECFPNVYTHLYLNQTKAEFENSKRFIISVTGMSFEVLIRKHFRVLVAEFLFHYHDHRDKVTEACQYIQSYDPESQDTDCLSLVDQVAEFLYPRFLGILSYFDCKLVNSKVALSVKKNLLQSFACIIKAMGSKYVTPLRFKILSTLRSALALMDIFPKVVVDAWHAFVCNVDAISLGPLLANVTVSLLQVYKYAPTEIDALLTFMVVGNENLLSANIPDLMLIVETDISANIKDVVNRHVKRSKPKGFMEQVEWYRRYFAQDLSEVKAHALRRLHELLRKNQKELYKEIVASRNVHTEIVELHTALLNACNDADPKVQLEAAKCLGQLGGMKLSPLWNQSNNKSTPFVFSLKDEGFVSNALVEMTRVYQYENNSKRTNFCALIIQEILKAYQIAPIGPKKGLWDSFPEDMHQIMLPLLTSRYRVTLSSLPKKISPVFGTEYASSYREWAYHWIGPLIPRSMEWLVAYNASLRHDTRSLNLFLPYIVLHALQNDGDSDYILTEIHAVISDDTTEQDTNKVKVPGISSEPNTALKVDKKKLSEKSKCKKAIYELLDFLNRWMLEFVHSKSSPTTNATYIKVKTFMSRLSLVDIAMGSARCGYYARALQYLERAARNDLQGHLPLLAELYTLLDEPDAVSGLLTIKRCEPSPKEMLMAQLATGRLEEAAASYERMAQDGALDTCSRRNLVECYLGMDQPYTAYSLIRELDYGEYPVDLAAEALWRLGRWEQLEENLRRPIDSSKDNWGMLMGRSLIAFRAKESQEFKATIDDAFSRLLKNAEGHLLPLHIVTEVTQAREMLDQLLTLPDASAKGKELIETLLADWRFRFGFVQADQRSVEPLLRSRIILLQLTKNVLAPHRPRTAEALDEFIGKLWLMNAKCARSAGKMQQAYMYVLNAEKYRPPELFTEKAKTYWESGQKELALVTLKRNLEEMFAHVDTLTAQDPARKLCAKASLLVASYSDESAIVDVEANIALYKGAVTKFPIWGKSLASLARYYEKTCTNDCNKSKREYRFYAIKYFGAALQHDNTQIFTTLPRMLSLWLDYEDLEDRQMWTQMNEMIETLIKRLPAYLFLTAFSQIISRICHPVVETYNQIKNIVVKLILEYPHHTMWMLISVMKSSYNQRQSRCLEILRDVRLKKPYTSTFIKDFTVMAEKLIELCNKPTNGVESGGKCQVSQLVRALPRLLSNSNFSQIMMPIDKYRKITLPDKRVVAQGDPVQVINTPLVYITGIMEEVTILPSLQKPRKCTLLGSDGNKYVIMLKPKDDLRKDFRLMEFSDVVNGYLKHSCGGSYYIRTYSVVPLNEECGLIQWLHHLEGFRPILQHLYKQKGLWTSTRELKEIICTLKDPLPKKRSIFTDKLLPRYPPVFHDWFLRTFPDPTAWYQARSAYVRTAAVMSVVGYIVGLGDRHGENILLDSTNGDLVHVDFNCLFNKGESFEWPERVPFRLTHNMEAAMGPLGKDGMFRKTCEKVMHTLRSQTAALTSVLRPLLYDPSVSWQQSKARPEKAEIVNFMASDHLEHIKNRLQGMIRTKNKQYTMALSPEGVVEQIIEEATSIDNLCQMYVGWGAYM